MQQNFSNLSLISDLYSLPVLYRKKMAGNAPKSRGMLQYVFNHFVQSFKVGKESLPPKQSDFLFYILVPALFLHFDMI